LLVLEGQITVEQSTVNANDFALFQNDGELFTVKATKKSKVLILSGEPILEPLVHYGPFVMNTKQEINEAINDYNNGKFGYLE